MPCRRILDRGLMTSHIWIFKNLLFWNYHRLTGIFKNSIQSLMYPFPSLHLWIFKVWSVCLWHPGFCGPEIRKTNRGIKTHPSCWGGFGCCIRNHDSGQGIACILEIVTPCSCPDFYLFCCVKNLTVSLVWIVNLKFTFFSFYILYFK